MCVLVCILWVCVSAVCVLVLMSTLHVKPFMIHPKGITVEQSLAKMDADPGHGGITMEGLQVIAREYLADMQLADM